MCNIWKANCEGAKVQSVNSRGFCIYADAGTTLKEPLGCIRFSQALISTETEPPLVLFLIHQRARDPQGPSGSHYSLISLRCPRWRQNENTFERVTWWGANDLILKPPNSLTFESRFLARFSDYMFSQAANPSPQSGQEWFQFCKTNNLTFVFL